VAEAARVRLCRQLRARLGQLGVSFQILAEAVVGDEDARIDWVAVDPSGRAWVVLLAPEEAETPSLLVRGLAQRAWLEARLPDWRQLAPELPARLDARPRLLLIAPGFPRWVQVAAREADPGGISLARLRWGAADGPGEPGLEPVEPPAAAARGTPQPVPSRLASAFRSGLSDHDFGSNGG
jgi:hypothetical protein